MNSTEMVSEYVIANGPQGLIDVLEHHFERCQKDEEFAKQIHYILYQLGAQKSFIKVDMSKRPFQFWYYDLLGRPVTAAVKDALALFLTDTVGEEGLIEPIQGGEQHD